nr:putative alkaline phosphatase [Chaetoceros tenuissimus]
MNANQHFSDDTLLTIVLCIVNLQCKQSLHHTCMNVNLVNLILSSCNILSKHLVSSTLESLYATVITIIRKWNWTSRMASPSISSRSKRTPEVTNSLSILLGPSSVVRNVFSGGLGIILMSSSSDCNRPWVHIAIVLWSNLVRFTSNDEVCYSLREIRIESEVVVVISSYVECVLLPSSIVLDPVHHVLNSIIDIKHGSQHIIHVVSMSSPVDITLLVHEEESIVVLSEEVNSCLHMFLHSRNLCNFLR